MKLVFSANLQALNGNKGNLCIPGFQYYDFLMHMHKCSKWSRVNKNKHIFKSLEIKRPYYNECMPLKRLNCINSM